MMNTNIQNCNKELLEQQKQELEYEIVRGENAGHFAVFDLEAGTGKTRTAEKALVALYKAGKKAIFVRISNEDCRESMNNINRLAKENIAFAFNNEDVTPVEARKREWARYPIIIITHQKYRVLMVDHSKRKSFAEGRVTLVIDEFLSPIHEIPFGESEIETFRALFSNNQMIWAAFDKALHQPIDYLRSQKVDSRNHVTFDDGQASKNFNSLVNLIRANITNEKLAKTKEQIFNEQIEHGIINVDMLTDIFTIKNLCDKIMEYKQLFCNMCIYYNKKLYTTDQRRHYWYLDNNIMLDASGELQIAYSLNSNDFYLKRFEKVLDHSQWKIINIPVNTTSAAKEKIINFYDVVNKKIAQYGEDILVVGKKSEMDLINVPESNKGYFGNITGSNQWYDMKNVAIIQTHNLNDINYILKYLHYAKDYIDEMFDINSRSRGRQGKNIYSFNNKKLEKVRTYWLASEIYQAIKRINRNMQYPSEVLIFLNNEEVTNLIHQQMKNSVLEVMNYVDGEFEYVKTKQDEYIEELKRDSYAAKFLDLLAEIQNGMHQEMLAKDNRILKSKVREYLHIDTSAKFSNRVLNVEAVILYCSNRGITLNGKYIGMPRVG